jgi:hypothetical protein
MFGSDEYKYLRSSSLLNAEFGNLLTERAALRSDKSCILNCGSRKNLPIDAIEISRSTLVIDNY